MTIGRHPQQQADIIHNDSQTSHTMTIRCQSHTMTVRHHTQWQSDVTHNVVALATSTPVNYFQDGRTGIQMSARHGSPIPVGILRANVITRRSVSPALCLVRSTHCSTYEDKLRRPQFCRSLASRVEQSSSRSPSAEHFTASIQETTENVPVLG